ncbi:MAG TPA: ATP-dependent DNA helicase [Aquabacterium sp.]|nr:ATP-dependent DNA helicase [Aquabacterium sp.]HQC98506.1 ATP-dependent DNA helicase [Aquabacterium sp.]
MPPSDPVEPNTPPVGWTFTVPVRTLCEFSARHGDLDRRFTPSATAAEGLQGQQGVARRRGADYETEIALEAVVGPLRVRGRADGFDPRRGSLEEIKTIRGHPDTLPANRRLLHWAQLQTYGALFCRARGLAELLLALVYVDVASQTEVELREVFGAEALEALLAQRCAAFIDWARQEAAHRAARDAALAVLPFPEPDFRPGQRALAEAVYRGASAGRCLLAQAPTGIGKTLGTLFPLLRAVPARGVDRVAYLTCKGTARRTALQALARLREGPGGAGGGPPPLRVLALVPKEEGCEHPDKACHGDACPLARGFYDRLPAARQAAIDHGWLDAPALRRVALDHALCPYYLGQELQRWADVLVGDVHHLFDPGGGLWGRLQAQEWSLALLVDEAHNLVERTRRMHSGALGADALRAAAQVAPTALRAPLAALAGAIDALAADADALPQVLDDLPDAVAQALQTAAGALAEHTHQHPLAIGTLLDLHFDLQRFARLAAALGPHSLLVVQAGDGSDEAAPAGGSGVALAIHNLVPAGFLRPRWQALQAVTLFSATLAPPDHAQRLLGLPDDTAWIDLPPAFPPEHLQVQVAHGISTRWQHRARSLQRLVDLLARQFDEHPGNYLAFFSSFDYLGRAADGLAARRPDIAQWRQQPRMTAGARADFLARFAPGGQGIGFAVLGGVFAEGVDLPGTRLIGAFIATLALPPVSPLQTAAAARLDTLFGPGHGDADLVPAMQRVVQAAGRVLRTPEDRGWLWLLDDRYRRPEVVALLPGWWGLGRDDGPA